MTKQKKKRNKAYTGADAKITRPSITHVSAANRNKIQQWWFERKRLAKPVLITAAIAIVVIWLLFELVHVIAGGTA
jgi:hypothetical protein